jgi:hypothetical protein
MPGLDDRLRSPWARKALAVAGVLVAANLVLAVVGPSLPDPVTYPTREIQLAVERLDAMTAEGCADVFVTGNSVAAEALSAQRLADAWGLDTGVVSVLPGSIASVDVDWMNEVTLPRARPGTVVYVATPLMFVPEDLASLYGLGIYQRAVATRDGWAGDLHRWAVDHLPLFEDRLVLADPEALVNGLRGELPTSYDEVVEAAGWVIEPDGHIRSTGTWTGDARFLDAIGDARAIVGGDWRIDGGERDVLRAHFQDLEEQGIQVVMVIPPVTADLEAAFPGGTPGFDAYLDAARSVGEGTAVRTVDLSRPGYDDELFRDTHHLNQAGSDRLTGEVAAALAGQPFPTCAAVADPG